MRSQCATNDEATHIYSGTIIEREILQLMLKFVDHLSHRRRRRKQSGDVAKHDARLWKIRNCTDVVAKVQIIGHMFGLQWLATSQKGAVYG